MSIRQGKNESAHDFSLRFKAVLDKIPAYDETWVRNLFVWGLHANIAQAVNMKNPRTLNQAMKLAKRADIAMTMSRRQGQKETGLQEQRKAGDLQASGDAEWTVPWGSPHRLGTHTTRSPERAVEAKIKNYIIQDNKHICTLIYPTSGVQDIQPRECDRNKMYNIPQCTNPCPIPET